MFEMRIILLIFFATIFLVDGSSVEKFWDGYAFYTKDLTRKMPKMSNRQYELTLEWCKEEKAEATMADLFSKLMECSGISQSTQDLMTFGGKDSVLTSNMEGRAPSLGSTLFNKQLAWFLKTNDACRQIAKDDDALTTIKVAHLIAKDNWETDPVTGAFAGDAKGHITTYAYERGWSFTVSATGGFAKLVTLGTLDVDVTYENTNAMGMVLGWDFKHDKLICGMDSNSDHGVEIDLSLGTPGGGSTFSLGLTRGINYEWAYFEHPEDIPGSYSFSAGGFQVGLDATLSGKSILHRMDEDSSPGPSFEVGVGAAIEGITYYMHQTPAKIGGAFAVGLDYDMGIGMGKYGVSGSIGVGVAGGAGITYLYVPEGKSGSENSLLQELDGALVSAGTGEILSTTPKCANGQVLAGRVEEAFKDIEIAWLKCQNCPKGTHMKTIEKPPDAYGCPLHGSCSIEGQHCSDPDGAGDTVINGVLIKFSHFGRCCQLGKWVNGKCNWNVKYVKKTSGRCKYNIKSALPC